MRRFHRPRRLHSRLHMYMLGVLAFVYLCTGFAVHHWPQLGPLRAVGMLALIYLAVAVAVRPLARRISRPVERLTEANQRFGAGDLKYRIRLPCPPPDDELSRLLRSWNEMAARIETLVRGQKELLANVSHELRSPLARVRVALALLPDEPALQARLRDVEADLTELERLIDDVLTTSRLELSGLPLHLSPVELCPMLRSLAERAAQAGAAFSIAEDPDLPLIADGLLLRRALWNLMENAMKYGAPPFALSARLEGGRVVLSVTDEGPGIPEDEREQVLLPFYRSDKARTPGGASSGYGLGLTLARRIAEVHGGSIAITAARSEAGRSLGCRISLSLPLDPPAQ